MAEHNVGAIVSVTPPKEGDTVWQVHQVDLQRSLPPGSGDGVYSIDWSFGPVTVTGTVDTNTWSIYVSVSVLGINLGTFSGNLKDGLGIDVDLKLARGSIRFYLKNGDEVWVNLNLSIIFDGSYTGDYKIITV